MENTIRGCNKAGASVILRGCRTRRPLAACLQVLTPSKTLEQQQLARQLQAKDQAKQARDTQQRRLREMGLESRLDYGQKLFSITIDAVAKDLNAAFEDFVLNPYRSRRHAAAMPFFDSFKDRKSVV